MVGDGGGGSALLLMARDRTKITTAAVVALNILVVSGGLCILMIRLTATTHLKYTHYTGWDLHNLLTPPRNWKFKVFNCRGFNDHSGSK